MSELRGHKHGAAATATTVASEVDPETWREPVVQEHCPVLSQLLQEPEQSVLRGELGKLIRALRQQRSPRRRLKVFARLLVDELDASVIITDISQTGVRLWLPAQYSLHLHSRTETILVVRLGDQPSHLPVRLVRVAAAPDKHLDLGFEFASQTDEHEQLVQGVRSQLFPVE